MVGDAKATLSALLDNINFKKENHLIRETLRNKKDIWAKKVEASKLPKSPIPPQQIVATLNEICDDKTIIACDASFSCGWASTFFDVYGERRVIMPRGMSGLGYGLPAAIGVACAKPDANVIVLTGDGGLSYCLGEMATLKEQNLNIKVVVINNSILGWIKWYEAAVWDGRFTDVDTTHIDFARVAAGFGLAGYNLADPITLKSDLKKLISKKGPAVIDVISSELEACKFNDNPKAVEYVKQSYNLKNNTSR